MPIFKRAWRLKLELENSIKTFQELNYTDESLKIQFETTNQIGGSWVQGSVTLYGLNKDDMKYLSSSARIFQKGKNGGIPFKKNKIQLEVGYVGDIGIIAAGGINQVNADFTSFDNKITLNFGGNIASNLDGITGKAISIKGDIDIKGIAEEISTLNKIKLKWSSQIKPQILKGYSFLGTPFQAIDDFRKQFKNDLVAYFSDDGETLIVEPNEPKAINKNLLSEETGMLGLPTPTQYGLSVNSLLNNKFKAGKFIELKSKKMSEYNGVYIINVVKHRGGNYENEWVSQLELRRK